MDFSTSFVVEKSAEEAFKAITNPRAWWSENIDGRAEEAGDIFLYRNLDLHYCKVRLTEVAPGKKVVWKVLENNFSFTEDKTEWVWTEIIFEVSELDTSKTEVTFKHQGLVPEYECFDVCSNAWGFYINGSLKSLITTGHGHPIRREISSDS